MNSKGRATPFRLIPAGKDYIWGGSRLKSEFGKNIDMTPLAESWECSVHPDGMSIVGSGEYAGLTLSELLSNKPEYMGTRFSGVDEFPILIKFIDAAEDLSVQVHPNDDFARKFEGQNGKTEMWYVLDAQPGAKLVCGFAHDMTPELIREAFAAGDLSKHLYYADVKPNDVFFIEAGTVHSIGSGCLLVEVQENSNVTYRVFDYNRTDKLGRKRELHIEKAISALDMRTVDGMRQPMRLLRYTQGSASEHLCRCKHFEVDRVLVSSRFELSVGLQAFQVLLCLDGSGVLRHGGAELLLDKGDCVFLPAGCEKIDISGKMTLLWVRC